MKYIELTGYILECKAEFVGLIRKYLDDKGFDGYYNVYDYSEESLRVVGDIPCDNKEEFIYKMFDFLKGYGMYFIGVWE